jgi:DNA-binding response OmpR family regulator
MGVTKTVLVVDDDDDICQSIRTVLEADGYRVVTAGDGQQGLAVAEREAPDLVVVDMMMPRQSGFPVLQKLKSSPICPPVIMVTANEGSRHRAYAEILGVDDYLCKPFDLAALMRSVRRLCPLSPQEPAAKTVE